LDWLKDPCKYRDTTTECEREENEQDDYKYMNKSVTKLALFNLVHI